MKDHITFWACLTIANINLAMLFKESVVAEWISAIMYIAIALFVLIKGENE